jgi:hypothetical protein
MTAGTGNSNETLRQQRQAGGRGLCRVATDYDKIVCIDEWEPDDFFYEHGYYPEGTRDKAVYSSPVDVGNVPLQPAWRYLFKESIARAPWQFWMEIMAYRIGQVMEVPVPPALVGLSNREKPGQPVYGALIVWFYSQEERYIKGASLIGPRVPAFNDKTGQPHDLQTLLSTPTFTKVPDPAENRHRLVAHWAMILTFDTVIGNADRHPENWGIVTSLEHKEGIGPVRLSPAFDNGTAMSYERPEDHFSKFDDEQYVLRYLKKPRRARHHMRWSLDDGGNMNFFDFMRRFTREFPETRNSILGRLQFTEADLRARLGGLPSIPVDEGCRLTERRLDFTLKLVMKRTELLRRALEED